MKKICISGKKGSGKSYLAKSIKSLLAPSAIKMSYATPVYELANIVRLYQYDHIQGPDAISRYLRNTLQTNKFKTTSEIDKIAYNLFSIAKYMPFVEKDRKLLQYIGHVVGRQQISHDFWVFTLNRRIDLYATRFDVEYIVIDDRRYENEIGDYNIFIDVYLDYEAYSRQCIQLGYDITDEHESENQELRYDIRISPYPNDYQIEKLVEDLKRFLH